MLAVVLSLPSFDALAQQKEGTYRFAIASQPLAAALEAFGTACNVQVLYDSRLAPGRRASAVTGVLTPEVALQTLLQGTDLTAHYTESRDVVLLPRSFDADGQEGQPKIMALDPLHVGISSAERQGYGRYAGLVQIEIQRVVESRRRHRPGSYSLGLRLSVDPTGTISRPEVVRSTGDSGQDEEITAILQGARIGAVPPAGMPQPFDIVILVRTL